MEVTLTGPEKIRTRTLPDGRFRIGGLAAGTWRVTPRAMGFATIPPHRDVVTKDGVVTGVEFTMTDEEAPTVRIVSPAKDVKTDAPVTVRVEAADNRGLARVLLRVDGAQYGKPVTTAPFEFVLDPNKLGFTSFRITAVAEDRNGNRTESEPVKVSFKAK